MKTTLIAALLSTLLSAQPLHAAGDAALYQRYVDQADDVMVFLQTVDLHLDACYQALEDQGLGGMDVDSCQVVFEAASSGAVRSVTEPLKRTLNRLLVDGPLDDPQTMDAFIEVRADVTYAIQANKTKVRRVTDKLTALVDEAYAAQAARGTQ